MEIQLVDMRQRIFGTPRLWLFVNIDNAVAGMLSIQDLGAYAWINDLFVAEEHRRRGIGSALLSHALRLAPPLIPEGADFWGAGICAQNKASRALFERFGFRFDEEYIPNVLQYSRPIG